MKADVRLLITSGGSRTAGNKESENRTIHL